MFEEAIKAYNEAVYETDRAAALAVVNAVLAQGATAEDVVFRMVVPAVNAMMARIAQDPDANLAQHFMTAQIAAEVTEQMLAKFHVSPQVVGRVVIGSAYSDMHSLGKRIVMGCLKALMLDVIDLGVNVPPERFVDEAVARDAQVIAISAMMLHTAVGDKGCPRVRQILRERGLEDRIKIVVGGAPYRYDTELYLRAGADAWAPDGVNAGQVILELIKAVKLP